MNPLATWLLIVAVALLCLFSIGCERQRPIVVPTEQGE